MNAFDLFKPQQMVKLIEKFPSDEQTQFWKSLVSTDEAPNDIVEWDEIQYDRGLAPFIGQDAPSQRQPMLSKTHKQHTVAHIKMDSFISGRRLFFQERAAGELRPNAMLVLARELRNLRMKIDRSIAYLISQMLTGTITVDNTTVPGSEVSFTVTFNGVGTFTPSASWATATTKIFSTDLRNAKRDFVRQSGFRLNEVLFNTSVGGYMLNNDEAKAWLTQTQRGVQVFEAGMLGSAVGLNFTENDSYYDKSGTLTPYIGDNKVFMLPSRDTIRQYAVLYEGRGLIPRDAIGSSPNQLLSPAPSPGYYTYAKSVDNPAGVQVVVGWVGLPVLTFPELVMYGDVTTP